MTDRIPPRQPPPLPPRLEDIRPLAERTGSPLQKLRPPEGKLPRAAGAPRPPVEHRYAPPPRRPAEPGERSGLARVLTWAGVGLAGLAATITVALMLWSPAGLVREQLIARVKAQTGRDLAIAGPTSLSLFPTLAIAMSDVTLSAAPGMAGEPTLKMQALEASVPLLPLLQRQVTVERLVLRRPIIDLHVDRNGRRSWDFAAVPPAGLRYAQAGGTRPGQLPRELQEFVKQANPDSREAVTSRGPLAALEALSLEDVQIEGGVVRYSDDRSGFAGEVQQVDARIRLAGIASPLDAKGSVVWRGEAIAFDARLASPRLLSEDRPARLTAKISGRPIEFDYDGTITLGKLPEAEGAVAAKSASLRALMALAGYRPGDAPGFTNAAINGRLKASESALSLTDGALSFDQLAAQGSITVELRPGRPMVRGNLQIAELDLNRLMQFNAGSATASAPTNLKPASAPKAASPAAAAAAPAAQPAQSIEDLLREDAAKPVPRVRGYTRRHGWSDETIDLSGLRLADAELKLSVGHLIYRDIKVGQTLMRVAVKDRALTANFDEIQLYDGRGRGLLTVDGAAAVPVIGANFSLDGTQALALLKDAGDFDWVAGRARINLALGGTGASERQIVASLNGRADVQFKDGAIVGYNIQQLLGGIAQGRFAGLERSANARTDFSEMAASFTVQNGIASNKDLRLVSPSLRITGAGTANLPERTMDYLLRPKLVAAQPSAADAGGLEVPVKLTGSWDKPTIAPDLDAALKNPEQTVDTLKQLGRQFKNANPEAVNKAKDLLNRFLKPQPQ